MSDTTLAEVEQALAEMDPNLDKSDETYKVALAMLSAAVVGPSDTAICEFTGVSPEWWLPYADNLRKNGVFTAEGRVAANWMDPETGGIAFWIDVNVAQGLMERR